MSWMSVWVHEENSGVLASGQRFSGGLTGITIATPPAHGEKETSNSKCQAPGPVWQRGASGDGTRSLAGPW